jgi:histidinol-phosphate aminotransferase
VNLVTLAAAGAALREAPLLAERTRQIVATRDRFAAELARLPGLIVYPTAANFVLLRCRTVTAREVFQRLYDDYGILVRDVSNAAELAQCLRISIGTDADMDAVVAAMREILEGV